MLMLMPPAGLKVYVATKPVDFRNYAESLIMRSWLATVAVAHSFSTA
jgi:hypothetical protein